MIRKKLREKALPTGRKNGENNRHGMLRTAGRGGKLYTPDFTENCPWRAADITAARGIAGACRKLLIM